MDSILQATLKTLKKSKSLLDMLSKDHLSDTSVAPYFSSTGTHIRHLLDFYDCIFNVNAENKIDLTTRRRNTNVETDCVCAKDYLLSIETKLCQNPFKHDETVIVIDDLGMGKIEITYTYGSLLAQANSHALHHYAIISYILNRLGVEINDPAFGYNPTTPKKAVVKNK